MSDMKKETEELSEEEKREKKKAYMKEYYRKNKAWMLEYSKNYKKVNREQWNKYQADRLRRIYWENKENDSNQKG